MLVRTIARSAKDVSSPYGAVVDVVVDPVGPLGPDVPDEAAVVVVAAEVLVEVLADLVPGRIDGGITTGGNGSGSSGPDLAGISAANFLSIFGFAAA